MIQLSIIFILITYGASYDDIIAVKDIDLNLYLGDWYEIATSRLVHKLFEKDGYCVRATYSLKTDGQIKVYNYQRIGSAQGPEDTIEGYAFQPDPINQPGQLKVNLNQGFDADYWVIQLGPVINDKYDYAIVAEPSRSFMWVLSRNPLLYSSKYGDTHKTWLTQQMGYSGLLNKYEEQNFNGCASIFNLTNIEDDTMFSISNQFRIILLLFVLILNI